jgi:hypothetical protein
MNFPSPLVGEGCEGLASGSELSRSWVRGPRAEGAQRVSALASARTSRCAPLIQLRLGSALASPSLRILLPQGEKGSYAIALPQWGRARERARPSAKADNR